MSTARPRNGLNFTDAACAAAAEARRVKAESAAPVDTPVVFVTREPDGRFGWEIRRYGALVVSRSGASYPSMLEARSAGESALSGGR